MILSDDGEFLLVLSDGGVKKVSTKDGKVTPVKVKGEMVLKTADERAYIFNHSWRQLKKKFYDPKLHGVDWDFYYSEYKKFLPHINNNYDFAEMLSEMLGEMNASHTGSGYRFNAPTGDRTASLGLLYDYSHSETGAKVAEVLIGGPMDKAASKVRIGHVIEKIDEFGWSKHFRLALVDLNEESLKNNLFSETAAVNRGLQVLAFDNEPEAKDWLLSDRGTMR